MPATLLVYVLLVLPLSLRVALDAWPMLLLSPVIAAWRAPSLAAVRRRREPAA